MRTPRKYSQRTRAKAVGIAVVDGVTAAERQTGIPKETIQYWTQKPEFAHLRTTARETVVDQFWIGIQVGIEQVIKGLEGDAPLNHKADALRTLAERYALLHGDATSRTENREIHDLPDTAYVEAIHKWERLTRSSGEGAETTPEAEPAG